MALGVVGAHDESMEQWRSVAVEQDGALSRAQLLRAGLEPHDVRRLLRRREIVPVHRGVYLTHTGVPSWSQAAWAAVLACWPAALWGPSALPSRCDDRLHVAVDADRSIAAPRGVRLHRVRHLAGRTQWNANPPRIRIEHAVLDAAAHRATDVQTIAQLTDAVQSRWTTVERLRAALDQRQRIRRGELMASVLADIAEGACSVLEWGFLTGVERAHGLPTATRQQRVADSLLDCDYAPLPVVVELDGRAFHGSARQHERDLARDLRNAGRGVQTVRLGWAQVMQESCRTAGLLGELLRHHGWSGSPRPCRLCGTPTSRADSGVPPNGYGP